MHPDDIYSPVFAPCLIVKGENRPSVRQIENTSASGPVLNCLWEWHSWKLAKVRLLMHVVPEITQDVQPKLQAQTISPKMMQPMPSKFKTLVFGQKMYFRIMSYSALPPKRSHSILCWYCSAFTSTENGCRTDNMHWTLRVDLATESPSSPQHNTSNYM